MTGQGLGIKERASGLPGAENGFQRRGKHFAR
jgi:hypothetical protein